MASVLMNGASFIFLLCVSDLVSGQIRYSIPEEMEHGAFVGNVAEDLKLNVWELSSRKFRLVSDNRKQYMEVNLENGILFVNERIDRELICRQSATCSLSLQLALDNPLELHHVTVEILDINDNSPSFSKDEFSLEIRELIAPGARFPVESAHDPDVGTNTISTYQISPNEHFDIKVQTRSDGSKSAELLLEKHLDREQKSTFPLVLTAIDGGIPHRSGTARIIIIVLDSNDNAPVFDHEIYRTSVAENAPKDTSVIKINAADLDEGTNAELSYSFTRHVSQRIRELFKLDSITGEITVQGVLDFEESTVYELNVQAVDNAPPGMAVHAKVMVGLIDVNDNAPEVEVTSVSSTVPEDAQPGTVVAVISVTDRDSERNGQIQCQVPEHLPFKLQKSSSNKYKLVTNDILDRETAPVYNISISAWDGGSPPLSNEKSILVSVSDINDNAPRFTQSLYNVYLMENNTPGASIFVVTALDSDMDQNGDVDYAILENRIQEGPGYVTINSKNGNIYALRSFDYEQLKQFQFKVQAQDAGSPPVTSTAIVSVIILDQNDNAPVIVSPLMWNSSASVEIVPQSIYPGYLVTKVIATDADSGQNARLSYQLLEATDPSLFTVGLLSGEIRVTRRFRGQDTIAEKLVLCVKDNGLPSLSSTATISFSIASNRTEESSERTYEPRQLEYFSYLNRYLIIILGSTSFIFLVTIIFLVVLKFKQDRNIVEDYSSTVCCCRRRNSNNVFNQRPAPREPVNYSGPTQTEGYRYTVCLSPESSKSDFLFLKPCHPTLPFNEVNARNNNRSYCKRLADILKYYNTIQRRTMANALMSGATFILLFCGTDLVSGQFRYSIPEELEHGAFVGNIAEDLRLNVWELSARKCRLVFDDRKQYMEVNLENGILFVSERIDREQLCRQSSSCSLSFQIVLDNPLEIHPVAVQVLDVNDNSPSFPKNEFSLQISELIAPGARFPVETAHDPDAGTNTISTYQISANEHFGIKVQTRTDGSKSPELLLEKYLDREQQATFQLLLMAIDGGIPHRSGTAWIIITVVDVNDNAPVFDHEVYRTNVIENVAKGTLVTKISAADLDEGMNAELTYSYTSHVSQGVRQLFKLDPESGEIRVQGVLDFEESRFYELDVQAVDNGPAGMTGHAKIIVGIIDTNDNAPELHVTLVSSAVREDAPPGAVIALISVTDLDSGEYGQVQCQVPAQLPFTLQNSLTNHYKLVTKFTLNRETIPMYNISISAWDGGSPPLSTNETLLVSVSDINDNVPRFTQSSYNVYLMENNTPGASIFAVTALDPDLEQNAEISYYVIEHQVEEMSASAYITINSKNGNIYALRSFDYEQMKYFEVKVQAKDAGSPRLSSTATIKVLILDQNDNAPVIVSPLTWNSSASVEFVPQSVYPGYLVSKVIATDADSGQNARLSYQLLGATEPSLFTVGLLSGEIRAMRSAGYQDIITERLVLCVKDNGQPSLSSTVTISFSVLSNVTENSSERTHQTRTSEDFSGLNRYLIIILASTSFLFLVIIIFLVVLKIKQGRNIAEEDSRAECCYSRRNSNDAFNRSPAANEQLNYTAAGQNEGYRYTVCLSPESSKSDFLFLKPCHPTLPFNDLTVKDTNARI
uniref:uncharacterized protein n=1 Tax=Pristiophorus japonicus TaxID=55135 RepID=UPI00398EDDFF